MKYLVDADWLIDALSGQSNALRSLDHLSSEGLAVSIIAERFAHTRSVSRRQGHLIPDMDLLIAATALTEDLTLVRRNLRHFERIPDLRLYQRTR